MASGAAGELGHLMGLSEAGVGLGHGNYKAKIMLKMFSFHKKAQYILQIFVAEQRSKKTIRARKACDVDTVARFSENRLTNLMAAP